MLIYHRIQMCELAARETSQWLSCDPWEAIQPDYVPTAEVLDQYVHPKQHELYGILDDSGARTSPKYRLPSYIRATHSQRSNFIEPWLMRCL